MSVIGTILGRAWHWYGNQLWPKSVLAWFAVLVPAIAVWIFSYTWSAGLATALLASVLAAIFQVSSAYHAKVSHFLECFSRCNRAYAKLNGRLGKPSPPAQDRRPADDDGPDDPIIDYFNLCAEEHLMYEKGVIPCSVWDVWRAGIHGCARQNHIKAAWDAEMKASCLYYGFDLGQIMREHHKSHGRECKNRGNCPWDKDSFRKNS
jgi:hypothetical protein